MDTVETVRPLALGNGAATKLSPANRRIRSAVTNGTRTFVQGDGNSPWARRQRDLVALHAEDVGGAEIISVAQLSLCTRAATIEVQLEGMEGQLSLGQEVDLDLYNRLAGNLRRLLETLGVERVAKPIDQPPTLSAIAAQIRASRPSATPR